MGRDPYIVLGFAIVATGVLLVAGFLSTLALCVMVA